MKPQPASPSLLKQHNRFSIRVDECKYGRGVFADKDFEKGELIEVCPVILVPEYDTHLAWVAGHSLLDRYYFDFEGCFALALGYGSLYNHSKNPNAEYVANWKGKEMIFHATRKIKKGAQIFIDYGYTPTV